MYRAHANASAHRPLQTKDSHLSLYEDKNFTLGEVTGTGATFVNFGTVTEF